MIEFGVYAPDEATFWQSWQNAGIVDANRNFLPEYSNGVQLTAGAWGGQVVKTPAVMDGMTVVTPAVIVPGWHCNVRVYGPLEAEMTYSLPQTDADGNLLSIWERTWAADIFQLSYHEADPETGVPAGWSNANGVKYYDLRALSSPSNVWA
jgi:hypothetical protein